MGCEKNQREAGKGYGAEGKKKEGLLAGMNGSPSTYFERLE